LNSFLLGFDSELGWLRELSAIAELIIMMANSDARRDNIAAVLNRLYLAQRW